MLLLFQKIFQITRPVKKEILAECQIADQFLYMVGILTVIVTE